MLDFFLVLGQIPGTHIQVSFRTLVIGIAGIWLTIRIYRRPALRRKYSYWLRLSIFYIQHFRAIHRHQN